MAVVLAAGCMAASPPSPTATGPAWTPPPGFAPTGPTVTATVVRVVDGDTIVVRITGREERVRYIGIDTPESVKPDTPVEPFGEEAAAENRRLVAGRTVTLERDVSDRDQYGRLLRHIWLAPEQSPDGRWLLASLELVRLGYAQAYTTPPDVKYADLVVVAQRSARSTSLGLWESPAP
jgi:micrococcal nuclease